MTSYVPNPPWVDRVLTAERDAIIDRMGPDLFPEPTEAGRKKLKFTELGCGHYGCVLAVPRPGYVFKVSSDPTEAAFIAAAAQLPFTEGIVKYLSVFETRHRYRDRPVYVIVREGADNVGQLARGAIDMAQRRLEERVLRRMLKFKAWAAIVRDTILRARSPDQMMVDASRLDEWASDAVDYEVATSIGGGTMGTAFMYASTHFRGAHRVAYAVQACLYVAQEMANEYVGYLVGQALEHYIEHGILLADVHGGNIGQVEREDYSRPIWVITDPGHMVPLDPKWTKIEIPEL